MNVALAGLEQDRATDQGRRSLASPAWTPARETEILLPVNPNEMVPQEVVDLVMARLFP